MNRFAEFLRRATSKIPAELVGRCIVFGSAPLVLAGLKDDSNDLDLFVDGETYAALIGSGFNKVEVKPGVWALDIAEGVEAFETWVGVGFSEVSSDAVPRRGSEGFRVASLKHVHKFKSCSNREKDRPDVEKLDRILKVPHVVWRAAVHEAGHVIADHLHGFVPYEVFVRDDGYGETHSRDAWPRAEIADRYGISCLAGLTAEEVIGVADDTSEVSASGDLKKANEVLREWPGASVPEWKSKALAILEEASRRKALAEVALDLAERRGLSGEELRLT